MQQHHHFLFIGNLLFGPSHDQRCCQECLFLQSVGMHPMGAAGANREGVVALFARTEERHRHVWHAIELVRRRQAMPVDHRLFGQSVAEQHVELATCVEGEAGFAVWPKETIDLGSSAVDLDTAIVDCQGSGCCGADRTERMTGKTEDSGTRSAVQELSAIHVSCFRRARLLAEFTRVELEAANREQSDSGSRRLQKRLETEPVNWQRLLKADPHAKVQHSMLNTVEIERSHTTRESAGPRHHARILIVGFMWAAHVLRLGGLIHH